VRLTAAFIAHELRTQARSLRFRVLAVAYVAAGSTPAAMAYARRLNDDLTFGGATYAAEVMAVLPVLTAIFVFLISLDGITREQEAGAWSTVTLTGISSAGYLLRRWLALQAVLLPLTAVPLLAAGVAAAAAGGPGAVAAGPLAVPWLLYLVPLTLATSALALGLGTIAGGAVNAFLLGGLALALGPWLVNSLLGRFGVRIAGPLAWIDLRTLIFSVQRMAAAVAGTTSVWERTFPLEVSESPYDAGVAAEQYLARAAVPVALAAAVLGLAVLFLRRNRPDVRPLRISPHHPLRTFLGSLARLREQYTPDPLPAREDLLAVALALLVTAAGSVLILRRAHHYQALGEARFAAEEAAGPSPTPADLVPGRWRIEGTLGAGRELAVAVTAEIRNVGREPRSHLAFELNPFLEILRAEAGEGRLALARRWDRLAVDLTPPIAPGGRRELRFHLAGEPQETTFGFPQDSEAGFHKMFSAHLHARFSRDFADLSRGYRVPAISDRRIDLAASGLTPVLRYHSWKLDDDRRVPEETFLPLADISLSLAAPRDLFLADSCGGIAHAGRLASRCRLSPAELTVAGGRYRRLTPPEPAANGATVAVYPFHARLGELHLGFLARGTRKLEEAWPGLGDLRRTAVLEWPEPYVYELDTSRYAWMRLFDNPGEQRVSVRGDFVLLRETDLIRTKPFDPNSLVAEIVASRLARRRAVAPGDALFFRQLFRNLALQRLGLGSESGATVAGLRPGQESMVHIPPPAEPYSFLYWTRRFPALVAALRLRMGEEPLRRAVAELLAREGGPPATRAELFALLRQRSEAPLERLIEDFFVKGLLPEPVLEGVELRRNADGWRVTGRMVNRGDGEADCKIVLTTDLGPVETTAQAGAGESGGFTLTTSRRPQAVWLDPDRECHRLVRSVSFSDRVYFESTSG
jgi:hypothetical protein